MAKYCIISFIETECFSSKFCQVSHPSADFRDYLASIYTLLNCEASIASPFLTIKGYNMPHLRKIDSSTTWINQVESIHYEVSIISFISDRGKLTRVHFSLEGYLQCLLMGMQGKRWRSLLGCSPLSGGFPRLLWYLLSCQTYIRGHAGGCGLLLHGGGSSRFT